MILYAGSYTQIITGTFGGHGEGIYCFDFDSDNGSYVAIFKVDKNSGMIKPHI